MAKFTKSTEEDGCWLWNAGISSNGYGSFNNTEGGINSHVMAYELFVGEIHSDLHVCHFCNNKLCVRPEHLYLDTHPGNMNYKAVSGRASKRLTPEKVNKIRSLLKSGVRQTAVAKQFGVSCATVHMIAHNRNWSWLKYQDPDELVETESVTTESSVELTKLPLETEKNDNLQLHLFAF